MPAPSSRRSSVRGSASSSSTTRGRQPESQAKASTEEIDVVAPEGMGETAPESNSVSGRRPAGRNSRRMNSASGTAKSPSGRISARQLTPEDLAKRRQSIKIGMQIALGVALTVIVVLVLVLVVFKKDPQAEAAKQKIAEIERALPNIDTRAEFVQITASVESIPDIPAYAQRKAQLKKQVAESEARVEAVEREARVIENRKRLQAQFVKLNDPATDLDKLEIDCQAFMKNPVDPTGVPNAGYATEFAAAVDEVQVRLASITSERGRREAAATIGAVKQVQLEVEGLIKQEKYNDALKAIDTAVGNFPKADFNRVRSYVTDAAASAWTSVEGYVKNRYADYASPGITQPVRQKALEEARTRLDAVIATWGLEDYVSKARELRATY